MTAVWSLRDSHESRDQIDKAQLKKEKPKTELLSPNR
jgi:hypothetical protein